MARQIDVTLVGRTVLVVDDDTRNLFALTSILEIYGMHVLHAENGRKGIDTLVVHPEIDLVLMDVMMPEMDGYAATSAIRAMPPTPTCPSSPSRPRRCPATRRRAWPRARATT
ncbi:response regulator [Streptosporangium lutulentum]